MKKDSSDAVGVLTRDDCGLNQNGYTCLSVGERYPGPLPSMGCQISLGEMLTVTVRLENPSKKEVEEFRRLKAYGLYAGNGFPHGVLVWLFSDALSFETPFNPRREETIRSEDVRKFLCGESNMCRRVLLDENGIVRAFGILGMDWELVGLLRGIWGNPHLDWSDYEERYSRLIAGTSGQELWAKAQKWFVKNHLIEEAAETQQIKASVTLSCGKCEAAHESISRVRNALKESESREADQRLKITELQSHVSSLIKECAGLQARITSLSAGALHQEVAQLKSTINERDFRILEMEEEMRDRDSKAKSLEGKVDDFGRRIRWLESRLRENGLPVL